MAAATVPDFRQWLVEHMQPTSFVGEMKEEDITALSQALVNHEVYLNEQYFHIVHGGHAFVLCLDHDRADEETLRHFDSERLGIPSFKSFLSNAPLPGHSKALRIIRLDFGTPTGREEMVRMPEYVAPVLYKEALRSDSVQYRFFPEGANQTLLCFAWRNAPRRLFLYRLALLCRRYRLKLISLRFAYAGNVNSADCVLLGSVHLEGGIVSDQYQMSRFTRDFELAKNFVLPDSLAAMVERRTVTGNQANLLSSFACLLEQVLSDLNSSVFTEKSIVEAFTFHQDLSGELLNVFELRCFPRKACVSEYELRRAELRSKLNQLDTGLRAHDDRRRTVFLSALAVVENILRTNFYESHKLGIGFRLAPEFLDSIPGWDRKLKFPQLPHGIYFVTGGKWFAFHIRFRELSRGGMRTVVARGAEHEAYERPNMFSECYNLALTQQKKNKDIPEGGAKSILFLRAEGAELEDELRLVRKELGLGLGGDEIEKKVARYRKEHEAEYMYYSQRCFLRTILSMFVWDFAKSRLKHGASTLDYLRSPEFIYFGPDENFHDCMIEWVAQEAQRMGYYPGGAFISGKARAGINHKEFGVTSLGALQFLNQGLSFLGIGQGAGRFTVKMTGGPDGDVAGNFLRLMRKNYGTRAAVVVITDGSGTAYEPKGFDLEVLEGMFHRVEAISEYPPERLSEEGWVLQMNKVRQASSLTKECRVVRKAGEEWIPSSAAHKLYASNAHVTPADVFLPCGGRPRSLSVDNVESFFDPKTGAPTSRLVVEGANLYITPQAREVLEDRGVVVFKDSSANKCGVVSSSYEILAGLSLTEDQFAKIKPDLARDILSRLETIANDEARCMIEYYAKNGRRVHMAQISELVSERINKFTDEIAAFLKPLDLAAPENAALHEQFVTYVPQCIRSKYLSQCIAFVPEMHKKAIIATRIACNLVYSRGLDWEPSVVDILEILLPQVH